MRKGGDRIASRLKAGAFTIPEIDLKKRTQENCRLTPHWRKAGSIVEPTSNEHDSSTIPLREISRKKAMAELRKLELEVDALERGRDWEGRIARFIPIITAVISIAGFILGVVIFTNQQAREREAREQDRKSRQINDYRTGYEQLLLFSSNEKMTVARVLALKDDLDALQADLYKDRAQEQEKRRMMGSICNLIARDFDFTQPRQVTFDIAALQNWSEYQDGLVATLSADGTGQTVNDSIIDKYLHVVRDLELKEPGVFKNVNVDIGTVDPEVILKEPQRSVVNGFACHLNLLEDQNKREEQVERFGESTGAFKLAAFLKKKYQCPPIPAIPTRPAAAPQSNK